MASHILHSVSKGNIKEIKRILEKHPKAARGDGHDESPLHYAAGFGQPEAARLLIEYGAEVNEKCEKPGTGNVTPLHNASKWGHTAVVELLTSKGADIRAKDDRGETPLHYAAKEGQKETVSLLIKSGAMVDSVDKDGETPLHKASRKGSIETVRLLIDKGANATATTADYHHSPLFSVAYAYSGNVEIAAMLLEKGADINLRDRYGSTPLHYALYQKKKELAKFLIEQGADINAVTSTNATPLHYATEKYLPEIMGLLVEKGAEIDVKDGYNSSTPLANLANLNIRGSSVFIVSDKTNPADSMRIIADSSVTVEDIKRKAGKKDPSSLEVIQINEEGIPDPLEYMRLLVDHGADVNTRNKTGATPLHHAACNGGANRVLFLIEKGADVNAVNDRRRSPLHEAAVWGSPDMVEVLLKHGARLDIKDENYSTPLMDAALNQRKEVLNLLKSYVTDPELLREFHEEYLKRMKEELQKLKKIKQEQEKSQGASVPWWKRIFHLE